jgi:hypothetical protein
MEHQRTLEYQEHQDCQEHQEIAMQAEMLEHQATQEHHEISTQLEMQQEVYVLNPRRGLLDLAVLKMTLHATANAHHPKTRARRP